MIYSQCKLLTGLPFKKHDQKTWLGKQRDELNIRLEGKYINQTKNCVYLGGNVFENGRVEVEVDAKVRHRTQAG